MKEFYEKRLKQTELKHTMFIRELSRELEDIADKYELLVRSGEQFGEKGKALTDKLEQLAEIAREQYQDYIYHSQYFIKKATAEAEGYNFCVGDSVTLDNGKAIYEISDARKDGGKILYILSCNGETIEAEEQRIKSYTPF